MFFLRHGHFTPADRPEPPCAPLPPPAQGGSSIPGQGVENLSEPVRFMGMPKPPLPDHDRRDQTVMALLTPREKQAVLRFAARLGMSQSAAGRYLMMRGLAAENELPSPPDEEQP